MKIIEVITQGPQGPVGPQGPLGSINTSSFATTGSNTFIGNQIITGSISLSGSSPISGVDYIDFDITSSNTGAISRLKWNDTDGTLDLGLKGGNVTLQIGQEEVVRVVNKTGINLTEAGYQVVRLDGAQGNRIKVALAKGDADGNSLDTLGIVTENIAINQEGFITVMGLVRGINTTGNLQGETWNDGDALYLSPSTLGGLTKNSPTAPSHSVRMGYVVQSNPSNGSIFVKVDNGYELDELHNIYINTSSLAYGDLLMRDGNSVWVNTKQLSGSYVITGSLQATSFTGSILGIASTSSFLNPLNQSVIITGSTQGNVTALTISSNTASLNLNSGNFFTLQLVQGTNTFINPSNVKPGQSSILLLSTTGSATVSFPSTVKQPSGSSYTPTATTGTDILTFASLDNTNLYLVNVKNLI
jgi:hypothetical protein